MPRVRRQRFADGGGTARARGTLQSAAWSGGELPASSYDGDGVRKTLLRISPKILLSAVLLLSCAATRTEGHPFASDSPGENAVLVGMTDTAAYFPRLRGRRVAVLANHTAVAAAGSIGAVAEEPSGPAAVFPGSGMLRAPEGGDSLVHLVDLLHGRGFDVTAIFSPEHGFRGTADAGQSVGNSVDARTGIPIRSLYDGNARRPSDEAMGAFDVLVVDMQDVGLRFYTYYISMLRMMDACAAFGREVIVLDRPNPHGDKVDGPLLDMRYASGVGALPVPVLHGLTMGEIARMAVGEGWARPCRLSVVPCRRYIHAAEYRLPVAPSPNLPTQRAVYLYPTLCLFEGTTVSVGRGTEAPFEVYGHPAMRGCRFEFTPRATAGAKNPPYRDVVCHGVDLRTVPLPEARATGLSLGPLIETYRNLKAEGTFFKPLFEKLIGVDYVRRMIEAGASEAEIRLRWQSDLDAYRALRAKYLLYE